LSILLAFLATLIDELRVLFLDIGRVAQHPVAQVDGGRCGINGTGVAILHEAGQIAAVVDVGVREDHRFE